MVIVSHSVDEAAAEGARFRLPHRLDGETRTERLDTPEKAIAFTETAVRTAYARAGLRISEVRYGGWSQAYSDFSHSQDIFVATRLPVPGSVS